jgi:tRNA threonylcarbamoyladenosine biosynthesis protein TsaE
LRHVLRSPEETIALGRRVGALLVAGDLVCLYGDLGAGKTTFVAGVHEGLGCRGRVRSPSFTTLTEYPGPVPLHHFDLYRYEAAGAGFFAEFDEWLNGPGASVVEWADRFGNDAPEPRLDVLFSFCEEGRAVELRAVGEKWARRAGNAGLL